MTRYDGVHGFVVRAREADLRLAQQLHFTRLTLVPRFNAVGSWELEIPKGHPSAIALQVGRGIYVERDEGYAFSGPMTAISTKWSDSEPGQGMVIASGVCDNVYLSDRLCYQKPEEHPEYLGGELYGQALAFFDEHTGPAETVMHRYVLDNAGANARLDRRVPDFVMDGDAGRGDHVQMRARMTPLLTMLQRCANASGDNDNERLGFKVFTDSNRKKLVFTVFNPANLESKVTFSKNHNTLRSFEHIQTAGEMTRAVVGGDMIRPVDDDGEPILQHGERISKRRLYAYRDLPITQWGRMIERYVDASGATTDTELLAAALDDLADEGPTEGLLVVPLETPRQRWAAHFNIGDRVTVETPEGRITDVVREVKVEVTADGINVEPAVGRPVRRNQRVARAIARLKKRVERMQANDALKAAAEEAEAEETA